MNLNESIAMKADNLGLSLAPSVIRKPSPDTYLSDLDAFVFLEVASILDMNETWKKLFRVLPGSYYSARDLQLYEKEYLKASGSPSTALLRDMGHKGFKVVDLIDFLEKLQLERALVFIKDFQPVELTGPVQTIYRIQGGPNSRLEIECPATGFPRPVYQWFKLKSDEFEDWVELIDQCSRFLSIKPVRLEDTGKYCCRFSNSDSYTNEQSYNFTEILSVVVERDVFVEKGGVGWLATSQSETPPQILKQPTCPSRGPFYQGAKLVLECIANGSEPLSYEWYKNGCMIPGEKSSTLSFYVQQQDDISRYKYQCRVSNEYGSVHSDVVTVTLSSPREGSQFLPEDKVALVIANENYNDHVRLRSAVKDAVTVAKLLKELDFKVLAAVNLNRVEMYNIVSTFCKLLDSGAYGIFYYAGHGFEVNKQCYMMPIDAPRDYTCASCICIDEIKASMQQRNLALCFLLIDMCRKDPDCSNLVMDGYRLYPSKVDRNVICVFTTSYTCSALDGPEGKNGLFVKHLKNYIAKDLSVEEMLSHVFEDISVDPAASKKQFPSIVDKTLAQTQRSLTDKIHSMLPNCDDRNASYLSLTRKPSNFNVRFFDSDSGIQLVIHVTFELGQTVLCNSLEMMIFVTDENNRPQSTFTSYLQQLEPMYMQEYFEQVLFEKEYYVLVTFKNLQNLRDPLVIKGNLFHGKRRIDLWGRSLDYPLIANVACQWETHSYPECNKLSYVASATEDDESGIGSFSSRISN